MSARKLILLIVLGLLVVAAAAFWAGRAHEGDDTRAGQFDPEDRGWIKTVRSIAGRAGGLVGIGPQPFDLQRLQPADGTPAIRCRREACDDYGFSGTAVLGVTPDDEARYAELVVRPIRGSVRVEFEPAGADEEDMEDVDPETVSRGRSLELTVADDGGRLTLECIQATTCAVRFRSGHDH